MPPQETTALLLDGSKPTSSSPEGGTHRPPPLSLRPAQLDSFLDESGSAEPNDSTLAPPEFWSFASAKNLLVRRRKRARCIKVLGAAVGLMLVLGTAGVVLKHLLAAFPTTSSSVPSTTTTTANHSGPYRLVERQVGKHLFDYYDFLDGPDSLGSAGFNVYVGADRAFHQHLATVEMDPNSGDDEFVILRSQPGQELDHKATEGSLLRESVRLEGKRRMDRGLFVLDVPHVPSGCGVWPAFWLTDEDAWPHHGEIDIVEGVNNQRAVKTALHTSEGCSMYGHVPPYSHTGYWDRATGIPNTWTGLPDVNTSVPADNCWVMAPHQWANQGCVAIADDDATIGQPFNDRGGGVYALEWDPTNGYIKSWVFPADAGYPDNLQATLWSAHAARDATLENDVFQPNPNEWGIPYAYFAIGDTTGCSVDHFQNHRLIFNLAFCGTVAGNRFLTDCPDIAQQFEVRDNVTGYVDPVATCNAYVASNPPALQQDAYWKVRGVYVYVRE